MRYFPLRRQVSIRTLSRSNLSTHNRGIKLPLSKIATLRSCESQARGAHGKNYRALGGHRYLPAWGGIHNCQHASGHSEDLREHVVRLVKSMSMYGFQLV
jgi:hypothetical protein